MSDSDRKGLTSVAKLSNLKQLLVSKARMSIEGLPGYERAKTILKSKCGKPSEDKNTHTRAIMSLPIINPVTVKKIHDFYKNAVHPCTIVRSDKHHQ